MSIPLADDFTVDIADGFDDGREEVAPGVRLFLLEQSGEESQGLIPIDLPSSANGEVFSGWLPSQPNSRGRLIVQICELGEVTRAVLERVWALALLIPGEAAAAVYELATDPDVPTVPTIRRWTFDATYTVQPYVPVDPSLLLLSDGSSFLLLSNGVDRLRLANG